MIRKYRSSISPIASVSMIDYGLIKDPYFFVRSSGTSFFGTGGHLGFLCTEGRAWGFIAVGGEGEERKTEVRGRVRVRVPRRIASKMAARNANLDRRSNGKIGDCEQSR